MWIAKDKIRLKTYEILYVESLRHKIIFHTRGGEYHIYKPLKEIEKMLESSGFIRIHRSYIVNPRSMKIVKNYETILDNGTRLPISKAKYKEVTEELDSEIQAAFEKEDL